MDTKLFSTTGQMVYGNSWAYLKLDDDIIRYYQWFLRRRYHGRLQLHFPKVGAHVSVVRGADIDPIEDRYKEIAWGKGKDLPVKILYKPEIIGFNGEYFWLDVICPDLTCIRESLGLEPYPRYGFHLTIGKLYPEDVENFATYSDLENIFDMS